VLLHFDYDVDVDAGISLTADTERVVKLGQVFGLELYVEDGTDYLNDSPNVHGLLFGRAKLLFLGADGSSHDLPL
jgi:hypothetical protein